jgi:methylmalonyl-CoA mutase N-terminal domain/subunit
MTDEIERQTLDYLENIDRLGGMLSVIESGWVQRQIQDSAYSYQQSIESGERVVVGVNRFQSGEDLKVPTHRHDPESPKAQIAALAALRRQRDPHAVAESLRALESAAAGDENLLPPIVAAVRAYATVGEISDVFRRLHGEYREAQVS